MADIIDFAFYKQFGMIFFAHKSTLLKNKNKQYDKQKHAMKASVQKPLHQKKIL